MQGAVHIDKALTDVSIRYRNADFVADQVYPVKDVDKQSDKYYVYGKENFRVRGDLRTPGSESNQSKWSVSSDNYFADGHSLKDGVPREKGVNADPALDLMIDTTEFLTEQRMLNRESQLVAKLVADLTGTSLASQTSTRWDDDSNDPIALIRAQRYVIAKKIGRFPNVAVFSAPVFNAIINNAHMIGRVTGAQDITATLITAKQLAIMLEVDEVLIAGAVYDTAQEGLTASLDFVWGVKALLFYRPPSIGLRTLALGAHFRWRKALSALAGAVPAGMSDSGLFVETYYWPPTKSDMVEVHEYVDQKTICADAGVLFTVCTS